MRSIGRARCTSLGLVAVLGLSLAMWNPAVGSASAARAASPRITFYFGLRRPEAQARRAFFAVQQPGSASYRRFLTPRAVATRYGASSSVRKRFVRDIRRYGFSVRVDPSAVFARVTGSVPLFQRVFKVRITQGMGDNPPVITYATSKPLRLPPDLRPLVQDVVTSYLRQVKVTAGHVAPAQDRVAPAQDRVAPAQDRVARADSLTVPAAVAAAATPPARTGTFTGGCAQAEATGAFSYDQVRDAYGIGQLGTGAGASIAILGLTEVPSTRDIADNARCFAYQKLKSRTLLTDGETRPVPEGLFEPQEDLALARGMAPDASLIFTQAWPGSDMWFLGAAQVLAGRQLPESFSISYGICENDVRGTGPDVTPSTRAGANLLNSLVVRLGLAGVGTYASAGDFGSTCNGLPYSGVAWPASSPYVTAVGGTRLTLTPANQRLDEVVWNDLEWTPASAGGGAGGGGFSLKSGIPPFQTGLDLPGNRRAVPDVSAAASSFPGWPVVLGGHWVVDGGTSAAAPLVAAAMAVVSADLQRQNLPPVGPADGLFYYLARCQPGALWDVVEGNNGYSRKVPARYAKPGYDLASGLGVPQFAQVARLIPSPGGAGTGACTTSATG